MFSMLMVHDHGNKISNMEKRKEKVILFPWVTDVNAPTNSLVDMVFFHLD